MKMNREANDAKLEGEKVGEPRKHDWQRDIVYVFQLPRASVIPSISPFCLKLETWLRIADIEYENVDTKLGTVSKKGFVPFIELNGREIADSTFIINELTEIFHKEYLESDLNDCEKAVATAMNALIEDSFFWTVAYERSTRVNEVFSEKIFGRSLSPAAKLLKPFLSWRIGSRLKNRLYHQGMGRNTPEEVTKIGQNDMTALSTYLEKKKFMNGQTATRLDAAAFGHLAQIWFLPIECELKKFMGSQCPNLVEYLERMKSTYWPDWEEITTELSLHTQWKIQPTLSPSLSDAAGTN